MKTIPYIIPPGRKMRRWQTKMKVGRIFQPGETVYLIAEGNLYFGRAYAVRAHAWGFINHMCKQPDGLKRMLESFKPDIPTKVI